MACACLLAAAPARAATPRRPTQGPANTVIDGGSVSLNAMSIARDGTGAVLYTKSTAGVAHVFVSRLLGGGFQTPVQADAGLAGASSQPAVVAGQGGVLLVAFINGGALYVAQALGAGLPLSAPVRLYPAAATPSLSMSNYGKAYLAFTATDGLGGGDVRTAYFFAGQWALEASPLDASPGDGAGLGSGRPQVATAGDGTAIVVWGEAGHIYSRRVVKTTPSVVDEQADPPSLGGLAEVSSGSPAVSTGGDSSYASVAFQATFATAAGHQSRVLFNRLHGSQYDGAAVADGASAAGPEGADQPQTAVNEYGRGWVTSETAQSHQLFAASLGSNASFNPVGRVDSLTNLGSADPVPALAGLVSTLIAWQQSPGTAGPAEIRLRYAPDGADLGPEQVVSSPALGATDADLGLAAAGDVSGDAAVAWVQGTPPAARIVAAQLYQAPGGFSPAHGFEYSRTAYPSLTWSSAAELWGALTYLVAVDGVRIGQTAALGIGPPTALTNGPHTYQVTAVNQAGLTSSNAPATVFVDTVAPKSTLKLSGRRVARERLRLGVRTRDLPPAGLPAHDASGLAAVILNWGDGSRRVKIRSTASLTHVYTHARRYTITVIAVDNAGNRATARSVVRIARPAPAHKPTHKKKTKAN